MRLAAAEIGLQLDHRVAAGARQAQHRVPEQAAQALGQIGAAEKLFCVGIFGASLTAVDVGQIGHIVGLNEAPGGDIRVRHDDLAPRLQPGLRRALEGQRLAPRLAARRFGIDGALQFDADLAGLFGERLGAHRGQQPLGGIDGANGIVRGKRLFVGEIVADGPPLAHITALDLAQRRAEHVLPVKEDGFEKLLGIPLNAPFAVAADGMRPALVKPFVPVRAPAPAQMPLDKRRQPFAQQVLGAADPVLVRNRHGLHRHIKKNVFWRCPRFTRPVRLARGRRAPGPPNG